MKDRLEELQRRAQEFTEVPSENTLSEHGDEEDEEEEEEEEVITPEAVLFEEEPVIHSFLFEVQQIQEEITELETEVLKFSQQQKTLVATMRRFSVMKKESSITRDIKIQAERLNRRLDVISKQAQRSEEQRGPNAATTRIQRSQHAALYRRFQKVMCQYNENLLSKQNRCKDFIIRQLEVLGKDVTDEEVNEMFATGKWDVFNENLVNDTRITRSQLTEIELRHKELLSLENNMKELKDLFTDIFLLVEEQGADMEHIQTNVERTQDFVAETNEKFKLALRYKQKNPLRQMCCCCCPRGCCL